MKVFKYPLKIVERQTIEMPSNSNLMCVQLQGGTPVLYAAVDDLADSADVRNVVIGMAGTGHDIPADVIGYIGTIQMGAFVWHFFPCGDKK